MGKSNGKEGTVELDKKTQSVVKDLVARAKEQASQIEAQLQERIGLIITGFINAKGKEGTYVINKDFTKLEKQEK